jgi:hypothetical protein
MGKVTQRVSLEGVERIRRVMHEGQEYWSVVDVIAFLTDSANPSKYWYVLQKRMQSEGARETLSQIIQLPMRSADGRLRKTDAMTRPTLLRLVQSIPSPKAEPFMLFLAEAGSAPARVSSHRWGATPSNEHHSPRKRGSDIPTRSGSSGRHR